MTDDWRVRIDVQEERGLGLLRSIRQLGLAGELRERLGRRVAVSQDGPHVFLYADSEAAAREALILIGPILAEHDLTGGATLWRWHPIEERWEDAALPLPATEDERGVEAERRAAHEASESERAGYPEWEVRLTAPDLHQARELADRLRDQGIPTSRRWRYVMVGAVTEEEARALAERVRGQAPDGTELEVELNGQEVWRIMHPFAVFGGVGT